MNTNCIVKAIRAPSKLYCAVNPPSIIIVCPVIHALH